MTNMDMTYTRRMRGTTLAAAVTATAVLIPLTAATGAQALGNNREAHRSCGVNYISSGHTGDKNWAKTEKLRGTCKGRLSAALEKSDGSWTKRVYGSSSYAYASYYSSKKARYGLHWGCDKCSVSKS